MNDVFIHDHEFLNRINEEKENKKLEDTNRKALKQEISIIPGIGISPIGFIAAKDMRYNPIPARNLVFPFSLTEHPFWWIQSFRRKRNPETITG